MDSRARPSDETRQIEVELAFDPPFIAESAPGAAGEDADGLAGIDEADAGTRGLQTASEPAPLPRQLLRGKAGRAERQGKAHREDRQPNPVKDVRQGRSHRDEFPIARRPAPGLSGKKFVTAGSIGHRGSPQKLTGLDRRGAGLIVGPGGDGPFAGRRDRASA
jgi:hypothetical protein